jgi:hypothetical protein
VGGALWVRARYESIVVDHGLTCGAAARHGLLLTVW